MLRASTEHQQNSTESRGPRGAGGTLSRRAGEHAARTERPVAEHVVRCRLPCGWSAHRSTRRMCVASLMSVTRPKSSMRDRLWGPSLGLSLPRVCRWLASKQVVYPIVRLPLDFTLSNWTLS